MTARLRAAEVELLERAGAKACSLSLALILSATYREGNEQAWVDDSDPERLAKRESQAASPSAETTAGPLVRDQHEWDERDGHGRDEAGCRERRAQQVAKQRQNELGHMIRPDLQLAGAPWQTGKLVDWLEIRGPRWISRARGALRTIGPVYRIA